MRIISKYFADFHSSERKFDQKHYRETHAFIYINSKSWFPLNKICSILDDIISEKKIKRNNWADSDVILSIFILFWNVKIKRTYLSLFSMLKAKTIFRNFVWIKIKRKNKNKFYALQEISSGQHTLFVR